MGLSPLSGAATRSAHYSSRPPVPGVNRDHFTPQPEPDPFNPQPDVPPSQAGTVWGAPVDPAMQSNMPSLAAVPVTHDGRGVVPVPAGVDTAARMDAHAARMTDVHGRSNYVPDGIRLYQHATEGQVNEFVVGRAPQNAGVDPGDALRYLVAGTNSYDATNQPNEVYSGDPANVGRYRLGVQTDVFGLYENPIGKLGQDASLRAYTGLEPAFPVSKPRPAWTQPGVPNSSGTDHWMPARPQVYPSNFSLPSDTAMTDFGQAQQSDTVGEFVDRDAGWGY